jgi:hypothetical protein
MTPEIFVFVLPVLAVALSQYPWHELIAPANIPNWVLAFFAGVAGWPTEP